MSGNIDCMSFSKDTRDRWWSVGKTRGLTNDDEIANFLLDQYDITQSGIQKSETLCVHCKIPLALYCVRCQMLSQHNLPSQRHTASGSAESHDLPVSDTPGEGAASGCSIGDIKNEGSDNPLTREHDQGGVEDGTERTAVGSDLNRTETEVENDSTKIKKSKTAASVSKRIKQRPSHRETKVPVVKAQPKTVNAKKDQQNTAELDMVDKDDGIVNESEAQKGGSAETQHPNQETNPLEAHVPKKKKHRPKMCSMCGKTMSREFTLKRHIELVHLKDSHSVVCPEEGCNKTFSRTKYLVAHMGDVHMNSTGETQTCHKCGKTFSSKKALADHSRYHGEIYNCTQCGANFPSRSSLYDHKRMCGTCEPISSPCGKIYQSSSGLWKHKKTCSLCIRSMTDSHISSTFNNDVPLNLSTSASTIHEAREPSTLLTPQSAS